MSWRGRALVMVAVVSLAAGIDGRNVPGTSYIDLKIDDKQEETTTTMKPTGQPIEAPGTPNSIDLDRTGVPGTSFIDRNKDTVNPDSNATGGEGTSTTTTPTGTSVKGPGTSEKIDVVRPATSYIDRDKGTVKPDSNATVDIVFPRFADDIVHANANSDGSTDATPSANVPKVDESHSNKGNHGSIASNKTIKSSKSEEIQKEEYGVQGGQMKNAKSNRSVSRTNKRKTKKSNSELLDHLGLRKLKLPTVNHHRKRLASQSRKTHRHTSSGDSKMFVIKLPPEPYYYTHHDLFESKTKPVNTLPVSFSSNGKPSRVYHWNIPVMKKMVGRKTGSSKAAVFTDSDVFNIDKQATWNDSDDERPSHRKTAYYAPKKASKAAFRKYFSGNGKPHSFYVMGKSKTPISTYRLLP